MEASFVFNPTGLLASWDGVTLVILVKPNEPSRSITVLVLGCGYHASYRGQYSSAINILACVRHRGNALEALTHGLFNVSLSFWII